jgi:beta-N-acetylhexosaminidase
MMVGLPEDLYRDYDDMINTLQAAEHLAAARTAAEESVTMVKETGEILPLTDSDNVLCLPFQYTKSGLYYYSSYNFTDVLENALGIEHFERRYISKNISPSEIQQIVDDATNDFNKVVIGGYDWIKIESSNQLNLVNQLIECPTPVIYVSFGSPYHLMQCKKAEVFMCAYCSAEPSQNVAAEILLGDFEAQGELPVIVPGWPAFAGMWEIFY